VEHVRRLIEQGQLHPGDRLPPERDLAVKIGVSRPSLRSGLQKLGAMGVVVPRQGAGTFVSAGPPRLENGSLRFLAALHGFTRDDMFEARRVLEVGSSGLAAERATAEQLGVMAEEVAGMFASLDDPQAYLGTTSSSIARSRPARATPCWRRSSTPSPRWSTRRAGSRSSGRATSASRRRCTGGSTAR
jgi:DNA-binding FadR family transcriptional regulator